LIPDGEAEAVALAEVAKVLPASDPDRARLAADAEHVARSITNEEWKSIALAHLAKTWLQGQ
jgi:hypothetical protein